MKFEVLNGVRRGKLPTRRATLATPFFMPIATKGAVKNLSVVDIAKLETSILLANTYHLMIRPGEDLVAAAGDLHGFMNWNKAILTDSGGFQVFSLAKIRKVTANGVSFRSHLDGRRYEMTPEDSIRIQLALGSDIIMVLDECVALPAERKYLEQSVDLTIQWAARCRKYFDEEMEERSTKFQAPNSKSPTTNYSHKLQNLKYKKPLLFGIVQGGLEKDLRIKCAEALVKIGFDGYAIGGLSVGESEKEMYACLKYLTKVLPEDKPRYLMGVGRPENIVNAIKAGVDMFDCVIPTREARHGRLYLVKGEKSLAKLLKTPRQYYEQVNIRAEKFKRDFAPINAASVFPELRDYTRAYLRHLFAVGEPLAMRLATLNNLEFYLDMMKLIREG
jgi:queuine tRNA-ribosyltransferase